MNSVKPGAFLTWVQPVLGKILLLVIIAVVPSKMSTRSEVVLVSVVFFVFLILNLQLKIAMYAQGASLVNLSGQLKHIRNLVEGKPSNQEMAGSCFDNHDLQSVRQEWLALILIEFPFLIIAFGVCLWHVVRTM
jgi:hypothetical protein